MEMHLKFILLSVLSLIFSKGLAENQHQTSSHAFDMVEHLLKKLYEMDKRIFELTLQFEDRDEQLSTRLNNLEEKITKAAATPVAFTAVKTGGQDTADTGEALLFEHVVTNVGNAFDPVTSLFTCPVSGTYFFTFHVFANKLKDAGTSYRDVSFWELVVDDQGDIAEARAENEDNMGSMSVMVTNSAAVQCNAGSVVWVRSLAALSNMYGNTTEPTTSFSGFLLYDN